jgi:hypothetical protein
MFAGLRKHLTYANVVSSVCLFVLLGGAAYAATALPRNSVGTKQLKNHAVTLGKVSNSAQHALRGRSGPAGHPGATGHDGAKGRDGTAVAFVHVNLATTFDHAKNVSAVSPVGGGASNTGYYCLTLTVPVANVTGTLDLSQSSRGSISFVLAGEDPSNTLSTLVSLGSCPAGTNALAYTLDGAGNQTPKAFWASFN